MAQTTIRVETEHRDALARVAAERNETLDQALRRVLWEHDCQVSAARLAADPEAQADYDRETIQLGNSAVEVLDE